MFVFIFIIYSNPCDIFPLFCVNCNLIQLFPEWFLKYAIFVHSTRDKKFCDPRDFF